MNKDELYNLLSQFENVCYSGGAAGADRLFGLLASEYGHEQIHFSFIGHKSHVDKNTVLELPIEFLTSPEIKEKLKIANKTLQRSVPKFGYVYNLLARNSFQIYNTERVYTIGKLSSPSMLDGGTAWAVQMYIDMDVPHEIYHYDINDNKIYSYDDVLKYFVEVETVPKPYGKWTGIGSRTASEEHLINFSTKFK